MLRANSGRFISDLNLVQLPLSPTGNNRRQRSASVGRSIRSKSSSSISSIIQRAASKKQITSGSSSLTLLADGIGSKTCLSPLSSPSKKLFRKLRRRFSSTNGGPPALPSLETGEAADAGLNVVQWMSEVCPVDVIPKILAYAGPKKTLALSRTNVNFHVMISQEQTWKILCEELYKWDPDEDEEPQSWKTYYRCHPCVPTDYATLSCAIKAAAAASGGEKQRGRSRNRFQASSSAPALTKNVRIFVRPGKYLVSKTLHINAADPHVQVTIETMNVLDDSPPARAVLMSQSHRRNEPLFRITKGELFLKNLQLRHHTLGIDIWNGNAVIHVDPGVETPPPPDGEEQAPPLPRRTRASAVLQRTEVTSLSGRGIVALAGANLDVQDSYIHDCAATGIYIGGRGTKARLSNTDVTCNGLGNHRAGGIARGHSGIYVEQGHVDITNSSISQNSAAGISVISWDATLRICESDVLSNGCSPVEIPFDTRNRHVIHDNNRISVVGMERPRSTLLQHQHATDLEATTLAMATTNLSQYWQQTGRSNTAAHV